MAERKALLQKGLSPNTSGNLVANEAQLRQTQLRDYGRKRHSDVKLTGTCFPGEVQERHLGSGWKRHPKPRYTVVKQSLLCEISICTVSLRKGNHSLTLSLQPSPMAGQRRGWQRQWEQQDRQGDRSQLKDEWRINYLPCCWNCVTHLCLWTTASTAAPFQNLTNGRRKFSFWGNDIPISFCLSDSHSLLVSKRLARYPRLQVLMAKPVVPLGLWLQFYTSPFFHCSDSSFYPIFLGIGGGRVVCLIPEN